MLIRLGRILRLNKIATSVPRLKSLGYPEVIAQLFVKRFGKNSYIIAQWMNDYHGFGGRKTPSEWINDVGRFSGSNMGTLLQMLEAADIGEDAYDKWALEAGHPKLSEAGGYDYSSGTYRPAELESHVKSVKREIEEQFYGDAFFDRDLIRDIVSGATTNVKQFRKMNFTDARDKYMSKKIYSDLKSELEFEDGYRWINVGPRCDIIGRDMKNCGSTGVMSLDPDRTMLTLVDKNDKPHIVTTYSPNEKRISAPEGIGSSAPKEKYHKHILDLISHLGVRLYEKSGGTKSKELDQKYLLRGSDFKVEPIRMDNYGAHMRLSINGNIWFSNYYVFISEEDITKVRNYMVNDEGHREKIIKRSNITEPRDATIDELITFLIPGDTYLIRSIEEMLGVKYLSKDLSSIREDLGIGSSGKASEHP